MRTIILALGLEGQMGPARKAERVSTVLHRQFASKLA